MGDTVKLPSSVKEDSHQLVISKHHLGEGSVMAKLPLSLFSRTSRNRLRSMEQARKVLEHLLKTFPFQQWLLAHLTPAGDWVVRVTAGDGFPLSPGVSLPWGDTPCHRMAREGFASLVPDIHETPSFAEAPLVRQAGISAYAGCVLLDEGDQVCGTLCAIHPTALTAAELGDMAIIQEYAGVLAELIRLAGQDSELGRIHERAQIAARRDALGIYDADSFAFLDELESRRMDQLGFVGGTLLLTPWMELLKEADEWRLLDLLMAAQQWADDHEYVLCRLDAAGSRYAGLLTGSGPAALQAQVAELRSTLAEIWAPCEVQWAPREIGNRFRDPLAAM